MARVTLTNVRKTYPGDVVAVQNANLVVEDKEFVVLVGPSGCGKSTTLRMIAGLEEISGGEIHIEDRVVNEVPPKDRDIAMVFQNYALYPHKNVYKNMSFGLEMRRFPKNEIDQRVREAAEILGITDLLQRRPKALSGGQRQRVAVGRAIVRKPKVFLFDEPLSNLDAKLRVQMRAEITRLHQRLEATMIYVTHDQVEAMTMGDRIVVMLDGVIQQVAPPMELYQNPVNTFVATFIGSPPMNLLQGQLRAEQDSYWFVVEEKRIRLRVADAAHAALAPYRDKPIILGVRPEELELCHETDGDDGNSLEAHVDVVEPMGAETYVYLHVGDQSIAARIHDAELPAPGSRLRLTTKSCAYYFFDPKTTHVIR